MVATVTAAVGLLRRLLLEVNDYGFSEPNWHWWMDDDDDYVSSRSAVALLRELTDYGPELRYRPPVISSLDGTIDTRA